MLIKRFLFRLLVLTLFGCAASQDPFTEVRITEQGFDQGGEFCKDFGPTTFEIEEFFSKAQVKKSREIHDDFDYLPCYIRGLAMHKQEKVSWEIRAGGTATVAYPNGSQIELGCIDCF